jgi:hypothetical protein
MYEIINPIIVNIDENSEESNIILAKLSESFSAIYIGMVRSAITKINPTTLIATTTVRAESIRISV